MRRLLPLLLLAGCNSILGIGSDHFTYTGDGGVADAPDAAPPDAAPCPVGSVCGHSSLDFVTANGVVTQNEDLSTYTIQAYITDSSQPTGYRAIDATTATQDGDFQIDNVPDGSFLLKLVPTGGAPSFYATDQRTLDLSRYVGGRPGATTASLTQDVSVSITGMQAWQPNDLLVAESYNTSTEDWDVETLLSPQLAPGATSITATYDWNDPDQCYSYGLDGRPKLLDASAGDGLEYAHARRSGEYDTSGRYQQIEATIDLFDTAGLTMTSGQPLSVSGAFSPVPQSQTLRFVYNRGLFEAGFDAEGSFAFLSNSAQAAVYTSPGIEQGVFVGPPIADVDFNDWSHAAALTSQLDVPYGDGWPAQWPRVYFQDYTRLRFGRLPGASGIVGFGEGSRSFRAFTTPVPPGPNIEPPANFTVAGQPAHAGGNVLQSSAVAPVTISWTGVSSASYYIVSVSQLYANGTQVAKQQVATFGTTGTSIELPAEVFTGSEFFVFGIEAVRAGAGFSQGHLRRDDFPFSYAWLASGRFRISTHCGNGTVEPGEACDSGGTATAQCNVDCTAPVCGDGMVDTLANGEQCDTDGFDTFACDSDCRLPVCGDGYLNPNVEDCDDGNTTDDGNGCSAQCKANNVCGDGVVQRAIEDCDDGNTTDDGNGCSADCKRNLGACGDGVVQSGVERCDDPNACSPDCQVITTSCGNNVVDSANGEQCDPPNGTTCNSYCEFM